MNKQRVRILSATVIDDDTVIIRTEDIDNEHIVSAKEAQRFRVGGEAVVDIRPAPRAKRGE